MNNGTKSVLPYLHDSHLHLRPAAILVLLRDLQEVLIQKPHFHPNSVWDNSNQIRSY
jgi:hypothetical protein